MAHIGGINIGGIDTSTNLSEFQSGIVFSLNSACNVGEVFSHLDNDWEVEVKQGHHSIVARSRCRFLVDVILTRGLELCQQALDLLSVNGKGDFQIEDSGVEHIILFKDNDKVILRQVSIADIPMNVQASITKLDKEGNIIPDPPLTPINWVPAFRFYRLSQGSNDLFEAYRNLFLGLESLLYEICPKRKGEGEKKWLQRSLSEVSKEISLSDFVPIGVDNPIEYFVKSQYDNIRCKLFHAKGHRAILPHQNINPVEVVDAYETLIGVWRKIASVYFKTLEEGGVITNVGFKSMMKAVFKNGFTFIATNDKTPPEKDDIKISPLNMELYSFDNYSYIGNVKPGQVLLIGVIEGNNIIKPKVIHRIGVNAEDILYSIQYIPDGLTLSGIDKFESYQTYRLINKGMPKTIF